MEKLCIVFCGQGSQRPGMGRELFAAFPSVRRLYACAGDILGFDVAKVSFEGDEAALAATEVAQPALYTHALAGFLAARERGAEPAAVAGHSLGEYGALTAAGVYTVEDGLRVIAARARAMGRAAAACGGAMYAVIGSDEETVERVCRETGGDVQPVNYNSPQQTVIAGSADDAARAADVFEGMGLKVAKLGVAGAFHTHWMQPAADAFYEEIRSIPYSRPKLALYSNVTGGRMDSIGDLPGYLKRHMVSPVLFTRQLAAMHADGCTLFAEAGPGKVLQGLIKRTLKGVKPQSLETPEGIEKVLAAK